MFLHFIMFITFDEITLQNNYQSSSFTGSGSVHMSVLKKALFKGPKLEERVNCEHGSRSGVSRLGVDKNCANFQKFINHSNGEANNPRNEPDSIKIGFLNKSLNFLWGFCKGCDVFTSYRVDYIRRDSLAK
jgi:hypothetical protein